MHKRWKRLITSLFAASLLALVVFGLVSILASNGTGINEVRPFKSSSDARQYIVLHRPGGPRVLVISDPNSVVGACSVRVRVGSLQDPSSLPGLAHFLEHLIFLGSKKYPQPDFAKFLSLAGGYSNAYTDVDSTNYFFQVSAVDLFEKALDRFVDAIFSPLLDPQLSQKEVQAVSSEHEKNRASDMWRFHQIVRDAACGNHPIHRFSTGNSDTLRNGDDIAVLSVRGMHDRFYGLSNADFVVSANITIQTLNEMVVSHVFRRGGGKQLNATVAEPPLQAYGCRKKQLLQFASLSPDVNVLVLAWEWSPVENEIEYRSIEFISKLFENFHGGLRESLESRNLVTSIAFEVLDRSNLHSLLSLRFSLTSRGVACIPTVLSLTQAFYDFLWEHREQALGQSRWDEFRNLDKYKFDFSENAAIASTDANGVSELAVRLALYGPQRVLSGPFEWLVYDAHRFQQLLQAINPSEALYVIQSSAPYVASTICPFGCEILLFLFLYPRSVQFNNVLGFKCIRSLLQCVLLYRRRPSGLFVRTQRLQNP